MSRKNANTNTNVNNNDNNNNNNDDIEVRSTIRETGCLHLITFPDGVLFQIWAEEYSLDDLRDVVNTLILFRQTNTPVIL